MPGKVANLSVGVSLDASEFTNGLNKAEAEAQSAQQRMLTQATSTGKLVAAALGGALVGAFAQTIASIPSLLNGAVDALDAFNDLRDATGSSIENISALDDIVRRAGGSFETVETALIRVNKALNETDGKDEVATTLRAIGLSAEELRKVDPAQQLLKIAVALDGFATNQDKAAAITILFGKSMKDLAPALQDVADRGALVGKNTDAQTEAAERLNKQFSNLKANAVDFARSLTNDVIPVLNQAFEYFRGDIEAGSFLGDSANARAQALSKQLGKTVAELEKLRALDAPTSDQQSRIARLTQDVEVLRTSAAKANEEVKGIYGAGPKPEEQKKTLPNLKEQAEADKAKADAAKKAADESARAAKAGADAARRAREQAESYIDSINRRIEKTEQLTEVEQVAADIAAGRVKFENAAQAGRAIAAASEADAAKQRVASLKSEAESAKALADAQRQVADEVRAIYVETRTPQEEFEARVQRLNELFAAGKIDVELYGRAGEEAMKRLQEAGAQGDESMKQTTEAAKEAQRSIQQSLGSELNEVLGGNFDDIGKRWQQLLTNMVAQAIAADLMGQLTGKGGGNTAGLIKGIGGLIGAAFGSGYDQSPYQNGSYTDGTAQLPWLDTGTNYVAKDGLAMIHKGEAVVPAKYNPALGGQAGGNVTIENHGQDVRTQRDNSGNMRVIVRGMIRDEMTADLAQGGPISQAQRRTFGLSRQLERRG